MFRCYWSVLVVIAAGCSVPSISASDGSSWVMALATPRFDSASQWYGWIEIQQRCRLSSFDMYQWIVRPGIGWRIGNGTSVWVGYAWIETYRPSYSGEHRLCQQMQWAVLPTLGARARIEERFFGRGGELRLRGQLRMVVSVGSVPLILANELFVTAARWERAIPIGYDQNRFQIGTMFHLPSHLQAEIGYMNIVLASGSPCHVITMALIYQP
ncbi:MAG: DUF2490 domain-containing protein [Chlorobi bacterium]|nr:DUF2490 domain-containing protein [Chlorobiota bacterium]